MNILLPCNQVNENYRTYAVLNVKDSKFFKKVIKGYSDTVKEIDTRHDNGFISINFRIGSDVEIVFGDVCPIDNWNGELTVLTEDFDFTEWTDNAIDDVLSMMIIAYGTIAFGGEGGTMGNYFSTEDVSVKWFLNNL